MAHEMGLSARRVRIMILMDSFRKRTVARASKSPPFSAKCASSDPIEKSIFFAAFRIWFSLERGFAILGGGPILSRVSGIRAFCLLISGKCSSRLV
jgi:hypothetical protein